MERESRRQKRFRLTGMDFRNMDWEMFGRHIFARSGAFINDRGDVQVENSNSGGGTHVTIYNAEENARISVDISPDGKEIEGSLHYTNQNADKGEEGRH